LDGREAQLLALETVVLSRRLDEALKPGGRPLRGAAVSSAYGDRQDPISGLEALHQGIDFAALRGTTVVAVAAGVVAASGYQTGLGNYVDINHGNGYVTRYGHNQRALVAPGQVVARGQPIATLGSSGRATGPHLHFEVLREGRPVDPLGYLGR
jgi:murein DD-endopeptidase MepM/ murein hydrolase activator NlpD